MDFFNEIFHNLALLEFYFLNIIYILLYIDFILSIFFQHSNILTRASHHWCLASNIVLVTSDEVQMRPVGEVMTWRAGYTTDSGVVDWENGSFSHRMCMELFVYKILTKHTLKLFHVGKVCSRAYTRFAPSQWETVLLCNEVSYWLGVSLESALFWVCSSPALAMLIMATSCHHWQLDCLYNSLLLQDKHKSKLKTIKAPYGCPFVREPAGDGLDCLCKGPVMQNVCPWHDVIMDIL